MSNIPHFTYFTVGEESDFGVEGTSPSPLAIMGCGRLGIFLCLRVGCEPTFSSICFILSGETAEIVLVVVTGRRVCLELKERSSNGVLYLVRHHCGLSSPFSRLGSY